MKIAVVGAGWAGLAAAIGVTRKGHTATVFEASQTLGGRARALPVLLPDGTRVTLDNGQHILIGAYTETLRLMRLVEVKPTEALWEQALNLQFPDGQGIRFPDWPRPLDALAGIATARGWSVADKWHLLRTTLRWQRQGFRCDEALSVADLCQSLSPRVLAELVEPLCISALNTPAPRASASVFLRVLHDALLGVAGGSHLLLPRTDLSSLFPDAAAAWLARHGSEVCTGQRVDRLEARATSWQINGQHFDAAIVATSASQAVHLLSRSAPHANDTIARRMLDWTAVAQRVEHEAIATVYAWGRDASLPTPMLALRSAATAPAQFVFDRGQLGGPRGLLAFVVSASQGGRLALQTQVLAQAQEQLGLTLHGVTTLVEKRATFACTPGLLRPPMAISATLLACGDHVVGPYPATLEGAVRSGNAVADSFACAADGKGR